MGGCDGTEGEPRGKSTIGDRGCTEGEAKEGHRVWGEGEVFYFPRPLGYSCVLLKEGTRVSWAGSETPLVQWIASHDPKGPSVWSSPS